jgi:RimJ/RimL family protein N-acetyltransferase
VEVTYGSIRNTIILLKSFLCSISCLNLVAAGVIGFHKIDWNNKTTSLGYWLGKGYEGSGLMTKSVRACVNHNIVELDLNRVEIRAAEENTKSAIPERLNFTKGSMAM